MVACFSMCCSSFHSANTSSQCSSQETCKVRLEDLYKEFGWDLYKRFGHAFDAFKIAVTNPEEVLGKYSIREDLMEQLH